MGNSLIKNFEQGQITTILQIIQQVLNKIYQNIQILQDLIKQQSLQSLLHNVKPEFLSNEEVVLLFIWTRPLVTNVKQNDEYSIYARGILGVDVIQSQGLLRNCETLENNLINIVESYFKLQRSMDDYEYDQLLRKAVYSAEKSQEVKSKLQILGDNWFNFKEQLKSLKLHEAPNIANPIIKLITNTDNIKRILIPYFDINISESKRVKPEANQLRKLLAIGKSEAQMIIRRKKLYTLFGIINTYFDMLVQNEMTEWKSIRIFDDNLFSLDLTNNFIDQDGIQALLELFFDNFDVKVGLKYEAPIPTSIRILILDYNFLGKNGIDIVGTFLQSSRQLKVLSLNRTRLIGKDLKKFCTALAQNPNLKALNMGQNKVGNVGMNFLAEALKINQGLQFLDLFDCDFEDDGAFSLAECILQNKHLINLRIANTRVTQQASQPLLNAVYGSDTLKIFRWLNLLPLGMQEYSLGQRNSIKLVQIESRNNSISRGIYLNPNIGDLSFDLIQDIYKCCYFEHQQDQDLDQELDALLQAYCDYIINNWVNFESGNYKQLDERPILTYRTLLTDQMVRDNLPELSREERILLQMETMDISKDLANNYLVDHKKQEFGSKKQSIQLYDQYGSSSKVPQNNNMIQKFHSQLDSVPNFQMSEFYPQSCFTKHLGKELLFTLVTFELNINFMNHEGFTPLIMAIKFKQKSLQQILLSGYIPQLDMNIKCENLQYKSQTALHIAVIQNDYDALKMLLEYQGNIKPDISIKDMNGKSPIDLAYMYNYPKMHQLLEQHTLRLQAVINEDLLKQNIILKKKEEEENKNYLDVEIDMFKRLLLQNQSSVYQ